MKWWSYEVFFVLISQRDQEENLDSVSSPNLDDLG